MNRGTRDTICATIGLLIVIALLTTVAALDSPGEMDEPSALSSAVPEPRVEMPEDSLPAEEYAYCNDVCLGLFELTAYCPCSACCGKNDGITATGTVATEGRTVAVDPTVIPYGTTIEVIYADGSSARYVAEDCGGVIKAKSLDVFFADHQAAREYGVRTAYVFLVQEGDCNE